MSITEYYLTLGNNKNDAKAKATQIIDLINQAVDEHILSNSESSD